MLPPNLPPSMMVVIDRMSDGLRSLPKRAVCRAAIQPLTRMSLRTCLHAKTASRHGSEIKVWILDNAKPVAERVDDCCNLDPFANFGHGIERRCAKLKQP